MMAGWDFGVVLEFVVHIGMRMKMFIEDTTTNSNAECTLISCHSRSSP